MKVRVLRLIEYEFDNQLIADEHLVRMTHSLDRNGMRMRSAIIQAPFGIPLDAQSSLSTEEAALVLGKSPMTVRRWAASGKIKGERHGKSWIIDGSSLYRPRPWGAP